MVSEVSGKADKHAIVSKTLKSPGDLRARHQLAHANACNPAPKEWNPGNTALVLPSCAGQWQRATEQGQTPEFLGIPCPLSLPSGQQCLVCGNMLFPTALSRVESPHHVSSILFGDTMVLIIDILLLGYSIFNKEYNLTRFNHQKNATHVHRVSPLSQVLLIRSAPLGQLFCSFKSKQAHICP